MDVGGPGVRAYSGFPGCEHDSGSAFDGALSILTSVVLITHLGKEISFKKPSHFRYFC